MKCPKSILLALITVLLITLIPLQASAASRFSYDATITVQSGGQMWFNYGPKGDFFLSSDWEEYDPDCLISSGEINHFTKILNRGIIACPNEGYYFAGFYNADGKKKELQATNLDILRVTVDGFYFYNCFPSKDNPSYKQMTKTAYENQVKLYIKGLYGTTRYKVMDTVVIYELPKQDGEYVAKFKKKTPPTLKIPKKITKTYGNKTFKLVSDLPDNLDCSFKSSNSKVLTVNKTTGSVKLKSPGKAIITCAVKESATTLPASYMTDVTVKPSVVKSLSAKLAKKTLSVKWSESPNCSGYQIQVSNHRSFKNIIAKKTVSSSKTKSTTIKLKKEVCNNYVRIRPYKISGGEKIYNQYTVSKIQ